MTDRRPASRCPFPTPDRYPVYDTGHRYPYYFFQEVIDHLEGLPAKTFLDLGCAEGELLDMIRRQRKGAELYGLDRSGSLAARAGERLADEAKVMVWDGHRIPLDSDCMNVVVSSKSFYYPQPLKVLSEVRRVLKNCGRLVLPAYNLPWPVNSLANALAGHRYQGRVKIYSKNQILDMLDDAGFHFEKWTDISPHGFVVSAMVVKPDH